MVDSEEKQGLPPLNMPFLGYYVKLERKDTGKTCDLPSNCLK